MDKKKYRQYQLHRQLKQNRYPVSIVDLCAQLEISDKTLYRDIQEFKDLYHAPVLLENGYLSYDKNNKEIFELPGTWFSDSELHALLAAQQLLSQIQPDLLDKHILPLKQLILDLLSQHGYATMQSLQRIRILGIGQRINNSRHFITIAGAVLDRKQCQLEYINRQNTEISQRIISPQRLIHYRDNWYLDAWCHLKNSLRTFSLDKIKTIQPQKEDAKDIAESFLEEHFESAFGIFSGKADKTAVLKFSAPHATYIEKEQWHPEQKGEWKNDKYIVTIPYHNPTELIMDILKYGAAVEVIKPKSLKQAIKHEISKMIELYEK